MIRFYFAYPGNEWMLNSFYLNERGRINLSRFMYKNSSYFHLIIICREPNRGGILCRHSLSADCLYSNSVLILLQRKS